VRYSRFFGGRSTVRRGYGTVGGLVIGLGDDKGILRNLGISSILAIGLSSAKRFR